MLPRSYLFVAGDDRRRVHKARETRAGAVIADLEDAVHAERKAAAREQLLESLHTLPPRDRGLQLVRINALSTDAGRADLAALSAQSTLFDGLVVPKARATEVHRLPADLHVVALIETAAGVREAFEIASAPAVDRLMLGSVDLGLELRLSPDPGVDALLLARERLVMDSAAARISAPIDGVCVDVRDVAGLRADARRSRALGFRAKACVRPAQIDVVEAAFMPSGGDVAWARRVEAAYRKARAQGRGIAAVDGRMVDAPVARRAEEILAEAAGG
jgi:citrate lyase subunit beta/citryl-CoA lyase